MSGSGRMIEADWKVSQVLKQYPQLLNDLVHLTPAFARLGNPVLRRVQAPLVTVAQAAGIAGLDPGDLVSRLNAAAGLASSDESERRDPEQTIPDRSDNRQAPVWVGRAPVVQSHDVRALIAHGEEPFTTITSWARQVGVGEVLQLEVPFEPVPLYEALGKMGFEPWAERISDDLWCVSFYRQRPARSTQTEPAGNDEPGWEELANAEVTIDVTELVPPEPMMRILEALESLPAGSSLLVHHVRRPIHLYEELDARGYRHATWEEPALHRVEVLIQKPASGGDQ